MQGEKGKTNEAESHADRQGERAGSLIGVKADQWLHDRSGQLECKGDQADLPEVQGEHAFQDRVDRRQQRLNDVV
jgi:hypothetical protein